MLFFSSLSDLKASRRAAAHQRVEERKYDQVYVATAHDVSFGQRERARARVA